MTQSSLEIRVILIVIATVILKVVKTETHTGQSFSRLDPSTSSGKLNSESPNTGVNIPRRNISVNPEVSVIYMMGEDVNKNSYKNSDEHLPTPDEQSSPTNIPEDIPEASSPAPVVHREESPLTSASWHPPPDHSTVIHHREMLLPPVSHPIPGIFNPTSPDREATSPPSLIASKNCQQGVTSAGIPKTHQHRLAFLDKMLENYDKRAWPTYGTGGIPTLVYVNIYINSLGSVNAANMEYSMDIYLRQMWQDPRLQLSRFDITEGVTLNGEDITENIWKPDLFFRNVKEAKFHKVTVPNKLIKLSPEGNILFSMRLTLRLACHMSFRHYPLDTQRCHIVLGPYAQTMDQVIIKWQRSDPIVIEQPLELPEFDVAGFTYSNFTRDIDTGSFSFLRVTFVMVRQNGYHLIQTYMPTFLIVTISWVSFWLNVDATPARVTLGVTTLLTLTTVASGVRTQLPPVSYVKAIDVWIGACSVMVFGALLEFTLVNYLSRSKLRPEEFKKSVNIFHWNRKIHLNHSIDEQMKPENEIARNLKRARTVDRVCRVMFPLMFFSFNMIYWPYYLYTPD